MAPYSGYENQLWHLKGARGGAVCCGTALQAGRSRARFAMVSMEFFIDMALGLTQPPTEMNIRNITWVVKAAGV